MKGISSRVKHMTIALLAAAAFAMPATAHALSLNDGDLVLALYGNDTEYFRDLGNAATLISGPQQTFAISSSALSAVGGANTVNWTLFSASSSAVMTSSSIKPASSFTTGELTGTSVGTSWNTALLWGFFNAPNIGGATDGTVAKSSADSFYSTFGPATATLDGGFPVAQQGVFGDLLSMIMGDANTNQLSDMGQAYLSPDGQTLLIGQTVSVPNPVPVPAAVWLFGTGLLGLVGVARRSMARPNSQA